MKDVVLDGGAARWQTTLLYLRRGTCAYFVGSVASSERPRRLSKKAAGLFEIQTADDECPLLGGDSIGAGYCETVWRFDGKAYARATEKRITRRPAGIEP